MLWFLVDTVAYICFVTASPVCLDFIAASRWLVVGLDNGTVMVNLIWHLLAM